MTAPEPCGQRDCTAPATGRMFWPGRDPSPGCTPHLAQARELAAAMGFSLVVELYPVNIGPRGERT